MRKKKEKLVKRVFESEDTYQPNGMFGLYLDQDSGKLNFKKLCKTMGNLGTLWDIWYIKYLLFTFQGDSVL